MSKNDEDCGCGKKKESVKIYISGTARGKSKDGLSDN